jgi:hypothetical protein
MNMPKGKEEKTLLPSRPMVVSAITCPEQIIAWLAKARTFAAEIEHLYKSAEDLAAVHFKPKAPCFGSCNDTIDATAHELRYALEDKIVEFRKFYDKKFK